MYKRDTKEPNVYLSIIAIFIDVSLLYEYMVYGYMGIWIYVSLLYRYIWDIWWDL
jgi:hypothetical protein